MDNSNLLTFDGISDISKNNNGLQEQSTEIETLLLSDSNQADINKILSIIPDQELFSNNKEKH